MTAENKSYIVFYAV